MSETEILIKDPVNDALQTLLERGRKRKYLTWEELNQILPDEAITPDKLEMIMMTLEENDIEMIDEIEAERLGVVPEPKEVRKGKKESRSREVDDGGSRRIDDPVRMYLTQMGEIPLLTRAQEISLAKKIELTRMAFRKQVLESDYCISQGVEILQQVADGRLPFDRTMKVSTSEAMAKNTITK